MNRRAFFARLGIVGGVAAVPASAAEPKLSPRLAESVAEMADEYRQHKAEQQETKRQLEAIKLLIRVQHDRVTVSAVVSDHNGKRNRVQLEGTPDKFTIEPEAG